MSGIQSRQQQRNAAGRDQQHWQLYGGHRRMVTRALASCVRPNRNSLCVLGAGNCNDLDLTTLAAKYQEIHLVDLDSTALKEGVAEQMGANTDGIHLHLGIDVTGISERLDHWSPNTTPPRQEVDRCIEQALAATPGPLPAPCKVVASTCLLSQLLESVDQTLGPRHPRYRDLLRAVTTRHLRLLVELTASGGDVLLITDFTSSDGWPEITSTPESEFQQGLLQQIQGNNFFVGMNPILLRDFFHHDPVAARRSKEVRLLKPWRWNDGMRTYGVTAIHIRCHG